MNDESEDAGQYAERPNKTAIKREMLALRELGKRLVDSPAAWLEKLSVSEQLKQEVSKAKQFRKGALRRQLIYLEKLLRQEDAEQIKRELEDLQRPQRQENAQFHTLEHWREQLLAGDTTLLEQLLEQFATLERQKLRQLIRNAQKEARLNKPPKSSRALFRYLRDALNDEIQPG